MFLIFPNLSKQLQVEQLKPIVSRCDTLLGALDAAKDKAIDLNNRLEAFGWDPNPFITLNATEVTFQPFGQVWGEFAEFRNSRNEW
jgi:hypothetical protein